MAMGKISVPANYSYLRMISGKLESDGIWNTPKYYEVKPSHAVSKMKLAVNAIVEKGFENSRMVSISDIWRELKKPPFGLLPNTGSVFLLGFCFLNMQIALIIRRIQTAILFHLTIRICVN